MVGFSMGDFSNIAAIVLASGYSRRMGCFKPLLPLGDRRMIERVIALFRDAGIDEILVVIGHRGAEIMRVADPLNVVCVKNPDYAEGMFTSVLAGVRALSENSQAFFIHPVDIPLVRWQTVCQLAEASKDSSAAVVYPTFNGQRGHPTLIRSHLREQILEWPGTGGLRKFLQSYDDESLELPVADEAVLLDLDTPNDYYRMLTRLICEGLPTETECRVLMEEFHKLPTAVVRHSQVVAEVARRIAEALHGAGLNMDVELVRTAALLHDIARTGKDHEKAGARLLKSYGFSRLAPIVEAHMDLKVDRDQPLDEIQIVYLADKLVMGDQVADLEQRFACKIEKYGCDPAADTAIRSRRDSARCIREKVERSTGMDIDVILESIESQPGSTRWVMTT